MKKIGIIFIAAILSLAMTACGRKKDDMATDPKNDNTTAPTILDPTIMDPTLDTNIPDPSVDTGMPDMVEPSEGVSPTRQDWRKLAGVKPEITWHTEGTARKELKGGLGMRMNGLGLGLGLGAAAGAIGIMMLSRSNPARKLAVQAATKVENAARMVTDKLTQKMEQ